MKRRALLLLSVGLLLISSLAAGIYFRFARPVGAGPAGPAVSRTAFAQVWSARPVLLLGMGDSVTAGFGARKGYSYFDRLHTNPPDEFPELREINLRVVLPNLQVTNLAVSGSTSFEHVEKQLPRVPIASSNVFGVVVVTTGGNDLIHNYGRTPPREQAMFGATWEQAQPWVRNFEPRLESILSGITAKFPGGCRIFLANIYDPTDDVGDVHRAGLPRWEDGPKILAAYNDIIQRSAARHTNVIIVDMHRAFLGHGIHCTEFWRANYDWRDAHYWYHVNLEDPNERGYDAIRRLFLNEMARRAGEFK